MLTVLIAALAPLSLPLLQNIVQLYKGILDRAITDCRELSSLMTPYIQQQ